MAASNHLINKCDQKNRQVKNQTIEHQIRRKIKATRLVKFLSCFFKYLECAVLGELQVLNALQHRFKVFSGILENGGTLKSVPGCYKNQEMCNKVVEKYPHVLEFVPECYKTQSMFDKALC